MPMTTEQATVGGRETFGEPKKIGAVTIDIDGDSVQARFERLGFTLAEVRGTLGAPDRHRAARQGRLLLQVQPVARTARGSTPNPRSSTCTGTRKPGTGAVIDGALTLDGSPVDPLADVPIGRILSMELAEVTTTQHGEVVERVPSEWLLPYVHQRYDDLSVLGQQEK